MRRTAARLLVLALATAACGAGPSSAPLGSGAAPSASPPTESPSPAVSVLPSVVLTGAFPGPDATIDPKAPPIIPGLRIEALAATAQLAGLTCESDAGS